MFLKSLVIENNLGVIRSISFRKGVNLVIDETPRLNKSDTGKKTTGNNVGKTTFLRLIDYCLAGTEKVIYTDTEFKNKNNKQIENFLKNTNVVVTLTLKENLLDERSKEILIKRNFLQKKYRIIEVNGERVTSKDFQNRLKELIFDFKGVRPTFRQIISKNIRNDNERLVNTVKVLHNTTTDDAYEALYLFWLGIRIDHIDRKQELYILIKQENELQSKLEKESTLAQIEQSLIVVNNNIDSKERVKNTIINSNYQKDLDYLKKIKIEISSIVTKISRLEMRKALIEESISELNSEISSIDVSKVRDIYKEASALIPNIQKTFEETLLFHNKMIENKQKYIARELPEINSIIINDRSILTNLENEEKEINLKLMAINADKNFEKIVIELNKEYENKGKLEEKKRIWESSNSKLSSYSDELNKINIEINSLDSIIKERITYFNTFFSKISYALSGESFIISSEKKDKGYVLTTATVSNMGTGAKKIEMAAFDIAYIQFADSLGLKCLHFILQDQIENVHENQIDGLLNEIIESNNCQYVFSVLKDKLPDYVDIEKYKLLSLSQGNKLFKI